MGKEDDRREGWECWECVCALFVFVVFKVFLSRLGYKKVGKGSGLWGIWLKLEEREEEGTLIFAIIGSGCVAA